MNAFTGSDHFHHGLYEVHLPVTDLQRSVDFYTLKLGFKLGWGTAGGSNALLIYDDEDTRWMLGLFRVDTVIHRSPAEYHIAFRVAEAQADTMAGWLRARGIEPFHPPHAPIKGTVDEPIVHGWMPAAAVFFQDPDGHILELVADLNDAPRPDFLYRPLSEWRALIGKTIQPGDAANHEIAYDPLQECLPSTLFVSWTALQVSRSLILCLVRSQQRVIAR